MDLLAYWLPLVWAAILAVAVTLYVILDGFGLGLGILFHVEPREERRDVIMNTIAPFWDGNQTWLVMGGAGLFVAFPKAYAIIMPALNESQMAAVRELYSKSIRPLVHQRW